MLAMRSGNTCDPQLMKTSSVHSSNCGPNVKSCRSHQSPRSASPGGAWCPARYFSTQICVHLLKLSQSAWPAVSWSSGTSLTSNSSSICWIMEVRRLISSWTLCCGGGKGPSVSRASVRNAPRRCRGNFSRPWSQSQNLAQWEPGSIYSLHLHGECEQDVAANVCSTKGIANNSDM